MQHLAHHDFTHGPHSPPHLLPAVVVAHHLPQPYIRTAPPCPYPQVSDNKPDEMYRAFAQRLPHRAPAAVREYCNLLIACVSEPLGPNGAWANGLTPKDLLGSHR